jgi:FkbM family methyltransferase
MLNQIKKLLKVNPMNALEQVLDQHERGIVHDEDFFSLALPAVLPRNADGTPPVILDIGANRGQSIVSIRKVVGPCKIIAFEANPYHWPTLEALAAQLGDVDIRRGGLGKERATLDFYVPGAGGEQYLEEATTRLDYFEKPWVADKFKARGGLSLTTIKVDIFRGDDLNLPKVDFIKIDVEGAEHDVLLGLESTIASCLPALLVENSDWHNVTAFLEKYGYSLWKYRHDVNALEPFNEARTNTIYLPPERAA